MTTSAMNILTRQRDQLTASEATVALLTNFIPPSRLPVYSELARRVKNFTVLLSIPMEANRKWRPDWGDLNVRIQRTLTINSVWKHTLGFRDRQFVHVPWNTIPLLYELRPDVIISAEFGFRSLFAASFKLLHRTSRLIYWAGLSEHTEKGRGQLRLLLRKGLLRYADAIVVNGHSGARYLRSLGYPARNIFRNPYTAVPNVFEYRPLERTPRRTHRLLYVGQLIKRKGVELLVDALIRWSQAHPDQEVEIELAGEGPLRTELAPRRTPPKLTLSFLGHCNLEQLICAYQRCDILAFPTLADDWGMVVNEAMAAGLPVLGSIYSQAVDELCTDNETGWRFRPDQPGQLDAALERAMSTTPERLAEMRQACRRRVKDLTPEYAADHLLAAIQSVLSCRGQRS